MLKRRTDLARGGQTALGGKRRRQQTKLEGVEALGEHPGGLPRELRAYFIRTPAPRRWASRGQLVTHISLGALKAAGRRTPSAAPPAPWPSRAHRHAQAAGQGTDPGGGPGQTGTSPPTRWGPRHLKTPWPPATMVTQVPDQFGSFRPVAAMAAGVMGSTGMESSEMVKGRRGRAQALLLHRRGRHGVPLPGPRCATPSSWPTPGFIPGSGGGQPPLGAQSRKPWGAGDRHRRSHGGGRRPTLCADLLAEAGKGDLEPETTERGGDCSSPRGTSTPRVADLAKVIGYGINLALQPGLTVADIDCSCPDRKKVDISRFLYIIVMLRVEQKSEELPYAKHKGKKPWTRSSRCARGAASYTRAAKSTAGWPTPGITAPWAWS